MRLLIILIISAYSLFGCSDKRYSNNTPSQQISVIPTIEYSVIKYFPHDTSLFTEGLVIYDGQLFESTGSPRELSQTKSTIGIVDTVTGKMNVKVELDKTKYFGEGIVFFKDKLYQLTYKNNTGFIYDAKSFKQLRTFYFSNREGWALTTDGVNLIMSDGTDKLTFLNPDNLQPVKSLNVTENGFPVEKLNELEFINGFIYSNIWRTDNIVKIDINTGIVTGHIDLSPLSLMERKNNPNGEVLNGIAYDPTTDKIYVTGKLWSKIYQVNFSH